MQAFADYTRTEPVPRHIERQFTPAMTLVWNQISVWLEWQDCVRRVCNVPRLIRRGQRYTTESHIAKRTGLTREKVRGALRKLVKLGLISLETFQWGGTIISVLARLASWPTMVKFARPEPEIPTEPVFDGHEGEVCWPAGQPPVYNPNIKHNNCDSNPPQHEPTIGCTDQSSLDEEDLITDEDQELLEYAQERLDLSASTKELNSFVVNRMTMRHKTALQLRQAVDWLAQHAKDLRASGRPTRSILRMFYVPQAREDLDRWRGHHKAVSDFEQMLVASRGHGWIQLEAEQEDDPSP